MRRNHITPCGADRRREAQAAASRLRRPARRDGARCASPMGPRSRRSRQVFRRLLGATRRPGRGGLWRGRLGAVYRLEARGCAASIRRWVSGEDFAIIDRVADQSPTPPHFAPLRVVGWGRRAAKVDGRGAWAARAALGMLRGSRAVEPRYPFGGARASAPATRRHAAMWSGAAAFWLWRPCWRAGRERRAAARRVDDARGDQPCGYAEDHRRDDLRPRMDAHDATAGPVYGGAEAPTDPYIRL